MRTIFLLPYVLIAGYGLCKLDAPSDVESLAGSRSMRELNLPVPSDFFDTNPSNEPVSDSHLLSPGEEDNTQSLERKGRSSSVDIEPPVTKKGKTGGVEEQVVLGDIRSSSSKGTGGGDIVKGKDQDHKIQEHLPDSPLSRPGKQKEKQPLGRKRPLELTDSVTKKKNSRKSELKELARAPPPFALVNCDRPTKGDEEVVFEAIRSLKQTDGSRFIKEQVTDYKMIEIKESQIQQFIVLYMNRGSGSGESIIGIGKSHKERSDRKRHAVKDFISISSQASELRSKYTDQIITDLGPWIKKLEATINTGESEARNALQLKYLDHLLTLLPLYLFHVDMINVVIPEKRFTGQDTLRAHRLTAGLRFLQHARRLIESNDKISWQHPRNRRGKYFAKVYSPSPFFWNLVREWIGSTRLELASQVIDSHTNQLDYTFKQFFNEILASFMEPYYVPQIDGKKAVKNKSPVS
ncbi:hypothetical protein MJO28_007989 [Puccinia striiformis f. sp. tritici]|uniref:Uncharacterized protein n=3 Tax=Puccinia striiformis f. sp. tritici TaxID=168172 RepID=A0A0L0UYD7_9BASI|nr:hypothetical protein MJO28_007989 [Puccinia striiformis f. sp. tritici]KAI9605338.1 hypothetical protein KEM48_002278 [Puccinia striiformis f. sp. tritici PST-130]KNE91774.1 hypothetical protein PSTG_14792 [Puccinia striiformis f. sp. tritici PST-78]